MRENEGKWLWSLAALMYEVDANSVHAGFEMLELVE
jgi:hypothetical protein